jgi:sialate O-acetylesterase
VRAFDYRFLFPLLIQKFREDWGQGDVPFYWVQLPNWREQPVEPDDHSWCWVRESQEATLDKVSNGGMAVAIDVGEGRDLHPKHKQPIADRLARIALARDYGFDLHYQSPRFENMTLEGNTAILSFRHLSDQGLYAFGTREVHGFAIAGEDRVFHWAQAEIVEPGYQQVKVWSEAVPNPVAVRYAWSAHPDCNLYDLEGLPVTPFRTDDWPQAL